MRWVARERATSSGVGAKGSDPAAAERGLESGIGLGFAFGGSGGGLALGFLGGLEVEAGWAALRVVVVAAEAMNSTEIDRESAELQKK